ncbi:MAG TPA: glycosyltransferase [Solirubrobacteraceae bacterium]|nr:glycosyltransferase [Solirubrobacteraceae bacterium]
MAEPVDIILLSYNRLDFLVAMVETLEARTLWPYRLTVVDNASGPQTRQWLRENAGRFRQIVWNERNEHLAALRHGIAATDGELFVVTDADLIVAEPTAAGCWLTRLVALATRHPDFGLLGVRLDSVSEARNAHLEHAPLIDGEVLEADPGVWLNLIRRAALRIPYLGDGITCHALRRSGYRVGVAAEIYATHLGDEDPQRHPDYLARKQAASGWRTTYPEYPELRSALRPPTLTELAQAAPVLAALERHGIAATDVIELCAPHAVLAAVEPEIEAYSREEATLGVRAVAVLDPPSSAAQTVARAFAVAGEWVIVLASVVLPEAPPGWSLVDEQPGTNGALARLAALASRPRWRNDLLYSTTEHRDGWLAVFRAGCFGDEVPLRVYVFRRAAGPPADSRAAVTPTSASPDGVAGTTRPAPAVADARAIKLRRHRLGTVATKLRRLIRAEWLLFRARGR